jgi:SH3-like domain-containing protein
MKKFTSYFVISLAAVCAFADSGSAPTAAAKSATPGASVIKTDRVNLRARPSRTAELIMQLKKGDEVKVLETKSVTEAGKAQEWSRITLPPSAKCYVLSKLLSDGKATGDAVNIRCGPGTNFKEVGKLAKGQKVDVVKAGGEWTQIKPIPQCSGWVASDYLESTPVVAPVIVPALAPAPPVAPAPSKPVEVVSAPVQAPVVMPPPPPPTPTPAPAPPAEPETLQYYVVRDGVFQTVEPEEKKLEKTLAPYELMTLMFERRQYRIAYLEMGAGDLYKFEGKHVRVLGNLRWRRGDRYPVIAVERIEPVW